jgi:hypothetical protein
LSLSVGFAQKQLNTSLPDDEFDYEEEFNYGLNWNTNGGLLGGGMLKYAKRYSTNSYWNVGLEIVNVKHNKELQRANRVTNSRFIPNKLNYLISTRPSVCHELVLFRKAPEEGVQVNFITSAGPTLCFIKPYYILYDESNNDPESAISIPFDPNKHNLNYVYGAGSPLDGLNKMRLMLGAHLKTSLSFEFGIFNGSVAGLEAGFTFERFGKNVPLMYAAPNNRSFSAAFITLYYGNKY